MNIQRYIFCLTLMLATTVSANPTLSETSSSYPITGEDANDLRQQMNRLGPKNDGATYDAYTTWYVRWNFDYQRTDNTCKMTQVHVTVDINTIYPLWTGYNHADPSLQMKWDQYMDRLQAHEQNHVNNGKNAGYAVEAMLSTMPVSSDCKSLENIANANAQHIIKDYGAKDVTYDRETRHGASEGLTFP